MAREPPDDNSSLTMTRRRVVNEVDCSTTRQCAMLRWLRPFAALPIYQNKVFVGSAASTFQTLFSKASASITAVPFQFGLLLVLFPRDTYTCTSIRFPSLCV